MLSFDRPSKMTRLSGDWQVVAMPLAVAEPPARDAVSWRAVPECACLQTVLYPDRPYWGDHLRAINEQAWFYRREFDVPEEGFLRARLRFEGVDYFASVWVNGQRVGEHEGSFEPFTLDVTHAIRWGATNELVVRVTAPWDPPNPRGSYPINHVIRGLVKGQYEHGEGVIPPNVNPLGIWRPVHLLLDDGISLDAVRIVTALDGEVRITASGTNATDQAWQGELALAVEAENHEGPGATARIPVTLAPGGQGVEAVLHVPDPRWWWPWDHGRPDLYRLDARLIGQDGVPASALSTTFGIRTVTLERSPERFTWRVNGRPVFLRGSSYMPGLYLAEVTAEGVARDVALAREANLNLLRVHVHVSPPAVYDACNRAGIMIWQDFELNWVQDPSPEFEARALRLQRGMQAMLFNHPSIITWTCHNEPTMVFAHRENYESRPDPALYADACRQDPTRPVFICSGQMEEDWQRAGDIHTYYGAMWSRNYTDVYGHVMRMNTEFGFEAPAAPETLRRYPDAWERLAHLEGEIDTLWRYQAELVQFHVEHLRRTRTQGSAGYVHFWLADLLPQVGCGVLDSERRPKGGFAALQRASQPVLPALEHDGRRIRALWVFNDTPQTFPGARIVWRVFDPGGALLESGDVSWDVAANASQMVQPLEWAYTREQVDRVEMALRAADGELLAENRYERPLLPMPRPKGYPWKFDPYLGFKVFDRPDAMSLVDHSTNGLIKRIPLGVRERLAEWGMRQKLPLWALSLAARITRPFVQ
ncbi:MAG: hypothetical protein Kow0077_30130 [Anaerolineae bacterium]